MVRSSISGRGEGIGNPGMDHPRTPALSSRALSRAWAIFFGDEFKWSRVRTASERTSTAPSAVHEARLF